MKKLIMILLVGISFNTLSQDLNTITFQFSQTAQGQDFNNLDWRVKSSSFTMDFRSGDETPLESMSMYTADFMNNGAGFSLFGRFINAKYTDGDDIIFFFDAPRHAKIALVSIIIEGDEGHVKSMFIVFNDGKIRGFR